MSAKELAQKVYSDGFVVLPFATYGVAQNIVERLRSQVLDRYEESLNEAAAQQVDLNLRENSERLAGFYVREGGRIDMQLSSFAPRSSTANSVEIVDMNLLKDMATLWNSVLKEIFAPANYCLEYIGCVLSRPGDSDQNWHLDGVHRNPKIQEPVDRLNVFIPLVDITDKNGGTEMKLKSHIHENGRRGTIFEDYMDLSSFTACVKAGTPILMDYRVWHRGLANISEKTVRPLLYFKYVKIRNSATKTPTGKKRKRITPNLV